MTVVRAVAYRHAIPPRLVLFWIIEPLSHVMQPLVLLFQPLILQRISVLFYYLKVDAEIMLALCALGR